MKKETLTLGADVGGEDAHSATADEVLALRKLLKEECKGPYSDTLKEFALVLRIDGSIQSWEKSGVDFVKLQKKAEYATADIFVPKEVWSDSDVAILKNFLMKGVKDAIDAIALKAEKGKIEIALNEFRSDLGRVCAKYLPG